MLDTIASERGYPKQVRVDNGPEFISHHMAGWARRHTVQIHFIQPGKPAPTGFVERFNRTYREDVLGVYLFNSLDEVRKITFKWLEEYNFFLPHASLGNKTPYEYSSNLESVYL